MHLGWRIIPHGNCGKASWIFTKNLRATLKLKATYFPSLNNRSNAFTVIQVDFVRHFSSLWFLYLAIRNPKHITSPSFRNLNNSSSFTVINRFKNPATLFQPRDTATANFCNTYTNNIPCVCVTQSGGKSPCI